MLKQHVRAHLAQLYYWRTVIKSKTVIYICKKMFGFFSMMFNKGIFQIEWKKSWSLLFTRCWLSLYTSEKHFKHLNPIEFFTQADPNNACSFVVWVCLFFFSNSYSKSSMFFLFLEASLFEYTCSGQDGSMKSQCKARFHSSVTQVQWVCLQLHWLL